MIHLGYMEIIALLGLTSAALFTTTLGFGIAWLRARDRASRAETAARRVPQAPVDERTRHLERAIDAIAVEVERIAEGQRFTTRLLSEQQRHPAAPGAQGRVITPH